VRLPLRLTAVIALTLSPLAALRAQQPLPTGRIGEYAPPRVWPQRARTFDLLHQRIAITPDLAGRSLAGTVETRLVILAAPTDTIRLDAANLTIDSARDGRARRLRFTSDTSGVTVRLARRAAPGDTVVFTLVYHGRPERGMYFVPRRRVIWTQGEATETHSWVPTYDAPNDKTTWEMLVTADSGMSVLSNGRLVGVTPVAGGARKVWDWSQELPASTYLYSVVVGPFTVLHDQWRGVPVDYWVAPDTVDAGWRTFGETPAMIELYSRLLGVNFPWAKYDQSVIPDFTYGGMENVSATTQTDEALHGAAAEPDENGRGLAAHELGHQWFGDLTTTATWAHIWLNEGITTYLESVQTEHSRSREEAQWEWLNQQAEAMGADRNQERPLVLGEQPGHDPMELFFSGHVYPKGAQVAHQLRRLLGDSLFWAGMHRFLVDHAYQPVETRDFAVAMERASGRDLDWFFDQWCYGIGYPKVQVSRSWEEGTRTLTLSVRETQTVDATHPFFRFPATVRVITRDSVVRHEVFVTEQGQRFAIPLPGAPLSFRFDEGGWLLGTVTTDQTADELAAMASHDLEFRARYWALSALETSTAEAARTARRLIALNDESEHMRQQAVRQLAADSSAASRAVVRAALADPADPVRAQALRSLTRLEGAAAVQPLAVDLIRHDRSTDVQAAALQLYDPTLAPEGTALLADRTARGLPFGVRLSAASRLVRRPDSAGVAALEAMTSADEPRDVRDVALMNLVRFPDKGPAIAVATRGLADGDPLYAAAAARQLGAIGSEAGRAALQRALATETRVTVKAAIGQALAGH
jgi:aminopeptidase N